LNLTSRTSFLAAFPARLTRSCEPSIDMESFRSSFINLSNVGMSSASITSASLLANQCVKVFDQIPPLVQDIHSVRSVSIPKGIITLEAGHERAVESGIGNTLAEIIKQYMENISAKQSEAIQSWWSTFFPHNRVSARPILRSITNRFDHS